MKKNDDDTDDHIQQIMNRIAAAKNKRKEAVSKIKFNPIKPSTSTMNTPILNDLMPKVELAEIDLEDVTKESLKIDKDYIRDNMKNRFRFAWKDPGYKNDEFGEFIPLRPQVLTEWELIRCIMPERSYKYVPEKGTMKMDHFAREFGFTSKEELGEQFRKFLEKFEKQHTDFVLRPSKYGKIKEDYLYDKIMIDSLKEAFRMTNLVQTNSFGFSKHIQRNDLKPLASGKLPQLKGRGATNNKTKN